MMKSGEQKPQRDSEHHSRQELVEFNQDLQDLLEGTCMPMLLLDSELRVKLFTPAAQQLFKIDNTCVGQHITKLSAHFDASAVFDEMRSVLADATPRQVDIAAVDGRHYMANILPCQPPGRELTGVVATFTDITARRARIQEIRDHESFLFQLIEDAPVPIVVYTEDGEVLALSTAWLELTGYQPEQMSTIQDWLALAYADAQTDLNQINQQTEQLFKTDARRSEGEWSPKMRDGSRRTWHFNTSKVGRLADGRQVAISTALDVTERRAAEQHQAKLNEELETLVEERTRDLKRQSKRLRWLASQLSQAEQKERRRLASSMHDNLQQIIAAARMQCHMLRQDVDEVHQESVDHVVHLLDQSIACCRDLTVRLAPPVLYEQGFMLAIRWLCENFGNDHGLKVGCDIDCDIEPQDQNSAVLLFQSVRELLFNVVKHAATLEANVRIDTTEQEGRLWLRIVVADEGRGMEILDAGQLPHEEEVGMPNGPTGFGLFSLRERIRAMGGKFTIDSSPHGGTRVTILSPSKQTGS